MSLIVENVCENSKADLICFLRKHSDHTLFMLNNLQEHGIKLTDAPNSANFKVIRRESEIVAAFCLCRRGTLLFFTEEINATLPIIFQSCSKERQEIDFNGVIGEWSQASTLWDLLKSEGWITHEIFVSKEILYSTPLDNFPCQSQLGVRLLQPEDYALWRLLNISYLEEMALPGQLSEEQEKLGYMCRVKKKIAWGLFVDGQLISIANLNAYAFDLGQLGGVYTSPKHRRKGYSKAVVQHLFNDCKTVHRLRKLIIFTGETNISARKVYESLGVNQIGYFGLLFGKH